LLFSNPQSSNLGSFLMGAFGQSGRDGSQLDIEPIAGHDDPIDAVRVLLARGVDGMILPRRCVTRSRRWICSGKPRWRLSASPPPIPARIPRPC
jgi:hypothetical protein